MNKIEELKNYIQENKSIEQLFFTGLSENTLEKKYQYLKNHFCYDIMNSWNRLTTIANKVKIFDLKLTRKQQDNFFEFLSIDSDFLYYNINELIDDFSYMTNTEIYFNGRSGGYLIIKPIFELYKRHCNILDIFSLDNIEYYNTFKEYKKENCISNDELELAYYTIKAFDKLCDVLRQELIYILDNTKIEEQEKTYTRKIKVLTF